LQNRLAIRYAVEGDLRFISHHDTLRLFERALARADMPVRFSDGFNPRPRISIVLPRSIGVSSSDELLLFEVSEPCTKEDVLRRLSNAMPAGLRLITVDALGPGESRRPRRAVYELPIDPALESAVRDRAADLMASASRPVKRITPKSPTPRIVDIRLYVERIDVADGRVRWVQSITQEGTVRPDEMLAALGLTPADHLHRLHRSRVEYDG